MISTTTEKNSAVSEEGNDLTWAYGFYLVVKQIRHVENIDSVKTKSTVSLNSLM